MELRLGRLGSLRAAMPASAALHGTDPNRAFRTATVLVVIGVLNLFDLACTHAQMARGNFAEANVLAAQAAALHGPAGVTAYKLVLFGVGAIILYRLRRHWESEAGAWVLLGCYTAVTVWWVVYLHTIEVCAYDPAVNSPPLVY